MAVQIGCRKRVVSAIDPLHHPRHLFACWYPDGWLSLCQICRHMVLALISFVDKKRDIYFLLIVRVSNNCWIWCLPAHSSLFAGINLTTSSLQFLRLNWFLSWRQSCIVLSDSFFRQTQPSKSIGGTCEFWRRRLYFFKLQSFQFWSDCCSAVLLSVPASVCFAIDAIMPSVQAHQGDTSTEGYPGRTTLER